MSADFFGLLERLVQGGVNFVIVGGFAGAAYGCCIVTQDMEICIELSEENLLRLQESLSGLNAVHRMTPKRVKLRLARVTCGQVENLYLDTDMGQLDCLGYVAGVGDYASAEKASEVLDVEGKKVRVLNLESLIESKKARNRARDVAAVRELRAIKELKKNKKQK